MNLGFPIIINSGYRCDNHNETVGGSNSSQHLIFATDARPTYGNGFKNKLKVLHHEFDKRFKGVGEYSSWVHGDLRNGKKARWKG